MRKDSGKGSETVATNEELAILMAKHNLTNQNVADLIEVSYETVINWGRKSRPAPMPKVALLALRLSIELKRL
jgi:DNA-binding transcriptional regulator YiaG